MDIAATGAGDLTSHKFDKFNRSRAGELEIVGTGGTVKLNYLRRVGSFSLCHTSNVDSMDSGAAVQLVSLMVIPFNLKLLLLIEFHPIE